MKLKEALETLKLHAQDYAAPHDLREAVEAVVDTADFLAAMDRTHSEITFTGAYTCIHHNDQQRAACPVCLVAALAALTAERDQLRADLAAERARLDWLESPTGVDWQCEPWQLIVNRARIDSAMKVCSK